MDLAHYSKANTMLTIPHQGFFLPNLQTRRHDALRGKFSFQVAVQQLRSIYIRTLFAAFTEKSDFIDEESTLTHLISGQITSRPPLSSKVFGQISPRSS